MTIEEGGKAEEGRASCRKPEVNSQTVLKY